MTIAAFITCRTGSSRLEKKALIELHGIPLIVHLIQRVKRSRGIDQIILCTTSLPEDNVLEKLALENGIKAYRGSIEDVLARYMGAAESNGIDFMVVVDGDDLFCDPKFIDMVAEQARSGDHDYIMFKGLPYGTYPTGIRTIALRKVCEIKDEDNTAGWGKYFVKTGLFKVKEISMQSTKYFHPEYRLTLDYPEDLELIKQIFSTIYPKNPEFSIDDVFALLEQHPELLEINRKQIEVYKEHFKKYSEVKLKKDSQD